MWNSAASRSQGNVEYNILLNVINYSYGHYQQLRGSRRLRVAAFFTFPSDEISGFDDRDFLVGGNIQPLGHLEMGKHGPHILKNLCKLALAAYLVISFEDFYLEFFWISKFENKIWN